MTTISILPHTIDSAQTGYRAVAGAMQSQGGTVGEALDALTSKLGESEGTTLVIVQRGKSDSYFSADQQRRMEELMGRWRQARNGKSALTPEEQAELESLAEAELRAAKQRAAALVNGLTQ